MSQESPPRNAERTPLPAARPWSAGWVTYYDRASRRRQRLGGYRRLRAQAKRKKRVELIAIAATGVGVASLVSVFYAILNH